MLRIEEKSDRLQPSGSSREKIQEEKGVLRLATHFPLSPADLRNFCEDRYSDRDKKSLFTRPMPSLVPLNQKPPCRGSFYAALFELDASSLARNSQGQIAPLKDSPQASKKDHAIPSGVCIARNPSFGKAKTHRQKKGTEGAGQCEDRRSRGNQKFMPGNKGGHPH